MSLLRVPNVHCFENISRVFLEKERILLDLLSSKHISAIIKLNTINVLTGCDLNKEFINEIVEILFDCKDADVAFTYLPIILHHMTKISKERVEILQLCYHNHYFRSKNIDKVTRATLIRFFTKSLFYCKYFSGS